MGANNRKWRRSQRQLCPLSPAPIPFLLHLLKDSADDYRRQATGVCVQATMCTCGIRADCKMTQGGTYKWT